MSARGDRLVRLDDSRRLPSREECEAIWKRVRGFARGGGSTGGGVMGWWTGELRWARNRVSLASDRRDFIVMVHRNIHGYSGEAITNQIDDVSLEAAVRAAERGGSLFGWRNQRDFVMPAPRFEYPGTKIWSDATYGLMTAARGQVARTIIEPAEAQGLLSAGYLEMRGQSIADAGHDEGPLLYAACTQAQCSLTVRDQAGSGSGWAGLSGHDWGAIDPAALAARALRKALASRNPVALEPGRYTVILEPQAVHDLVSLVIQALSRQSAELGGGPFTLGRDEALGLFRTKLGLKVADERVTIDHDPADPALGVLPYQGGAPARAVRWIDRGVLMALEDFRQYALDTRNDNLPFPNSDAFRMSGGETSVEEMIATTKRGLLVTRFSNVRVLDTASLLATGLTRDGLWLVENGKVSKPVKNFRFAESPLFVLNSIEQLGPAAPVFRPRDGMGVTPAVVPPLKVRDFSFTSTIDAV